jgi:hypothetical protein
MEEIKKPVSHPYFQAIIPYLNNTTGTKRGQEKNFFCEKKKKKKVP